MKKTLIGFALCSALGLTGWSAMAQEQTPSAANPPASTQNDSSPAGRAGHMADPNVQAQHMAKRLNLTSDQQTQVLSVLTAQRDQMAGIRNDSSLSREDRHTKMQAIRTDSESKIRALLTDNQKQTFDQMQQQRRERQQGHKG